MHRILFLAISIALASCTPDEPPSGPGAEVPQAHRQDVEHCAQSPEDPFCSEP